MRLRVLDRYVLRFFWSSYAICLVTLTSMFIFVDLFANLGRFTQENAVWWRDIPRYYAGQVPILFERFGAFMTLAAAMFAVARLERNNELLPMKAGGISIFRALAPVLASAALLGLASAANVELVIPRMADMIRQSTKFEKHLRASPGILRDAAGSTLYAQSYDPARETLHGVWFLSYDEAGRPVRELHGDRAVWIATSWRKGFWLLEDGYLREEPAAAAAGTALERIGRGVPRDLAAPALPDEGWPLTTTIRPIDVESLSERISLLSFRDLADQYRRQRYLVRLRVQLHARIAAPLMHVILCLFGLGIMLRASGPRSVFLGLLVLIVISAGFFVTTFIFQDLGADGFISPFSAAWAPTIAFALFGIFLFDRVRT
jgi:lipopolysaccharide export LptBFGC system permease protein LptF